MLKALGEAFTDGLKIDIILSNGGSKPDNGPADQLYGNGWELNEVALGRDRTAFSYLRLRNSYDTALHYGSLTLVYDISCCHAYPVYTSNTHP